MLHILVLLFCINYTTIVEMSRNEHFVSIMVICNKCEMELKSLYFGDKIKIKIVYSYQTHPGFLLR